MGLPPFDALTLMLLVVLAMPLTMMLFLMNALTDTEPQAASGASWTSPFYVWCSAVYISILVLATVFEPMNTAAVYFMYGWVGVSCLWTITFFLVILLMILAMILSRLMVSMRCLAQEAVQTGPLMCGPLVCIDRAFALCTANLLVATVFLGLLTSIGIGVFAGLHAKAPAITPNAASAYYAAIEAACFSFFAFIKLCRLLYPPLRACADSCGRGGGGDDSRSRSMV